MLGTFFFFFYITALCKALQNFSIRKWCIFMERDKRSDGNVDDPEAWGQKGVPNMKAMERWLEITCSPCFATGLVFQAKFGEHKVWTFSTVCVKHIHAGLFSRHQLWSRLLTWRSFAGLAWNLCVVVVRTEAHHAEVGEWVFHPDAVALLRIHIVLASRHVTVVKQVLRRGRDVQHRSFGRCHLMVVLMLRASSSSLISTTPD